MESYLQFLPKDLITLLERYVYGPIRLNVRFLDNNIINITWILSIDGSISVYIGIQCTRDAIRYFIYHEDAYIGNDRGSKEVYVYRAANNRIEITSAAIVIHLNAEISRVVLDKLELIVNETRLDQNTY